MKGKLLAMTAMLLLTLASGCTTNNATQSEPTPTPTESRSPQPMISHGPQHVAPTNQTNPDPTNITQPPAEPFTVTGHVDAPHPSMLDPISYCYTGSPAAESLLRGHLTETHELPEGMRNWPFAFDVQGLNMNRMGNVGLHDGRTQAWVCNETSGPVDYELTFYPPGTTTFNGRLYSSTDPIFENDCSSMPGFIHGQSEDLNSRTYPLEDTTWNQPYAFQNNAFQACFLENGKRAISNTPGLVPDGSDAVMIRSIDPTGGWYQLRIG